MYMEEFGMDTEESGNSELWKAKIRKEDFHFYFTHFCSFDFFEKISTSFIIWQIHQHLKMHPNVLLYIIYFHFTDSRKFLFCKNKFNSGGSLPGREEVCAV